MGKRQLGTFIVGTLRSPIASLQVAGGVTAEQHAARRAIVARGAESRFAMRKWFLGRIRGTLKREPLVNPLLALLNRDLIQRVYIPKGPPNPIP